ncbi:MobP2 family relaxase [Enterococcus hulanensis]|uniref:MobP2 family relaxase n=1 Tax=Enterococcus hulanensis TaxID=2559929 RepID=UPI0010F7A5E0|nr:MobP2 family relaxase [Enterococcus hulanensis]
MSSPGIIMTGKFAKPGSGAFQSYIEYMDREEAIRNEAYDSYSAFTSNDGTSAMYEGDSEETLDGYIKYMANPVKTSNLFSLETNSLDHEDIMELKDQFITAAENGSPMWQDVFSFRNDWLVDHGFLDSETNQLDEPKIQMATRLAMTAMLKKEDMTHSAIWTASIHYNTDNIHVHIATVEPDPTREMHTFFDKQSNKEVTERKGYRSRGSIRSMKSAFANQLLGLEQERIQIDELKKKMIEGMRSEAGKGTILRYGELLNTISEKLPPQKGYQKYGYAEKFGFKKPLDQMIEIFLKENYSDLLDEIKERQNRISYEEESAFGEGRNSSENKMKTLYTRLGNSILSHIKELDIQPKKTQHANFNQEEFEQLQEEFRGKNKSSDRTANELAKKRKGDSIHKYEVADFEDALKLITDHPKSNRGRPSDEDIKNYYQSLREKKWKQVNHNDEELKPSIESVKAGKDEDRESEEFDQAFRKVASHGNKELKNRPPTQQEIANYYESLSSKANIAPPPEADSYEFLFMDQSEYVQNAFNDVKKSSKEEFNKNHKQQFNRTKKKKVPKMSAKEIEKKQQAWRDEVERRKQFSKLKRILNDSTEQWKNEQKYQRMINEIEYLTELPGH